LGVGWLIQAYGESTKQTILHGIIQEQEITKTIQFTYTFDIIPIIRNILQKYQAKILSESYDKDITISIQINTWNREICKQEIINNSQGKIVI
jgi:putative IMPACT (imprinted ancient) family translation regulator